MDWLRNYEGRRGIGYLLVIASIFCPTYSAAFLLDNDIDVKSNVVHTLLLCASLGLAIGIALAIPTTLISTDEKHKLDDVISSLSISVGFLSGALIQTIFLFLALMASKNFYWYYSGALISGAAVAIFLMILAIIAVNKASR